MEGMPLSIVTALILLASSPASAQAVELDPSLPIPTLKYDRPPPDFSWELGIHIGFGDVVYWKQEVPPWVNFGVRAGWGKNFGGSYAHRIGVTTLVFVEGPMPIHMSVGVEPHLAWDWISQSGLWLGAGVGGAAMLNSKSVGQQPVTKGSLAPSAAVRVGWSQSWSRVGRRLFVGAEAKGRYTNDNFGQTVSFILGSGKGY